jgi:protein-S-isoprenylcysteine O-methyltransferase Ste14
MKLLIFSFSIIAYFALHSFLASGFAKKKLQQKLIPHNYFRLFYNTLATLLLLPCVVQYFSIEKVDLIKSSWSKWPGILLSLAGLIWVVKALGGYDLSEFIGTSQLKKTAKSASIVLKTNGLNAQVRHPLYFGTLLLVWGMFFIFPNKAALIIASVTTIYLIVGTKLEERKLEQQFGEAYRSYRTQVPMLTPFRWKSKKK